MEHKTITAEQAEDIRNRNTQLNAWIDTIRGRNGGYSHGWASYKPEDKPSHVPDVSNEERSQLEVYDFINNPPEKYFLYINDKTSQAITWMGDSLGIVAFGCAYRSNFGNTRIPVRVKAVNGRTYAGTYYKSSGDYARVRVVKGNSR